MPGGAPVRGQFRIVTTNPLQTLLLHITRERPLKQRVLLAINNFVATAIWLYAIVKLFVFDVDIWLVRKIAPTQEGVLAYKFPILVSILAIALITNRRKVVLYWLVFVLTFPANVAFWKFPIFVWRQKSWLFAFAIFNFIISQFRSFRRNFILATMLLLSTIIVLSTDTKLALMFSISATFVVLIYAYCLSFARSFKPSAVFQMYSNLFPIVRQTDLLKCDESVRNLPVHKLTSKQLEVRTTAIQNVVLYNRLCFFVAKRLQDYQKSRLNVITYIFGLIGLLVLTVFGFALINFGAFKIDPHLYQFSFANRTLFSFFYYSAGSMFYTSNGLEPIGAISQSIQMVQFLFAVFLFAIFAAIVVTMRTEKYTSDLNDVVSKLETEGKAMEGTLKADYNLASIASAIDLLRNAKTGLVGLILFVTKDLGD